jgi:hypothetical protein
MDSIPLEGGSLDFNSVSKYYGDQNALYGGKLHWPGIGGIPFRGDRAPLIADDNKNNLFVSGDANHATLDLSNDDDSKLYAWIRDRIKNGLFTLDHVERHWDESKKNVIIYIEWTQIFTQIRGA